MDLQLKHLIRLNSLDLKIIAITSMAGDLPHRIKLREEAINNLSLAIQDKESRIEELERKIRKLNAENGDSQVKLDKHKEQLFLVKSNKEYDALNEEIDYLKKNISESEDRFIDFETEKEGLSESKELDESEMESLKQKLIKEKDILDKATSESKTELDSLSSQRQEIVKNINESHLASYDKLKDAIGMGIAPLNDTCCGNCFSTLPPQMIIEIKSNNTIHSCPSCSVMAFWQEEMEEN